MLITAYFLAGLKEVTFIDFFAIEKCRDSYTEILDMIEAVHIKGIGRKHEDI